MARCINASDTGVFARVVLRLASQVQTFRLRTNNHVRYDYRARPPLPAKCRISAGDGTKGPRLHDWAYLELADLDAGEYSSTLSGEWTRGLLIRRNIADGDLAFFSTWCPKGTPMKKLVTVEGHRWAIEDSFETAKNEFGLDHNETRSWHGWHRHVSLVMLAFAMMAAIRHQANKPAPKKQIAFRSERAGSHPLVAPRNPPHSPAPRAKTHRSRLCRRVVALATRPSGDRTKSTPQTKITTVMLEVFRL